MELPVRGDRTRLERFAWGVLVVTLLVIVWGAFVRASGSGAGCGAHWPLCNGEVLPRSPGVATAIELTHRITSGLSLLFVVAELVWVFRVFPRGSRPRSFAVLSMVFMLLEAAVGALLVLLALVGQNGSVARAIWMAIHLVNTFCLVGALTLVPLSIAEGTTTPSARPRSPVVVALLMVLVVGVAGAITALGDTLFPASSLRAGLEADVTSTSFLVRLRVLHPMLAVLTAMGLAWLASQGLEERRLARPATAVLTLVVTQLLLGVVNLALLAPTVLQLLHLLVADGLWIALVIFAHRWWREPTGSPGS